MKRRKTTAVIVWLMLGVHTIPAKLGAKPRPSVCTTLERSRVGCFGSVIRTIGARGESFRLGLAAIELAHDIGANAPKRLLVSLGFLAFAFCTFVRGADEATLDEHVRPS